MEGGNGDSEIFLLSTANVELLATFGYKRCFGSVREGSIFSNGITIRRLTFNSLLMRFLNVCGAGKQSK